MRILPVLCLLSCVLILAAPLAETSLMKHWGFFALGAVLLSLLAAFLEFGSPSRSSKEISLVAMLGALSAAGRVVLGPLPSVQPSTFITGCTGYVFGPAAGFMVGALTALVSNLFLGMGPWAPFQMLGWGLFGLGSSVFGKLRAPVWSLAIIGFLWGYVFGFITNLWYIIGFGFPLTPASVLSAQLVSFPYDTAHAICNAAIFLIFGKRVLNILKRFRQRFMG